MHKKHNIELTMLNKLCNNCYGKGYLDQAYSTKGKQEIKYIKCNNCGGSGIRKTLTVQNIPSKAFINLQIGTEKEVIFSFIEQTPEITQTENQKKE